MANLLRNLGHTLAALTANCGEFHRAWEAAPTQGERWTGQWRSQVNGHQGELRCVLRRASDHRFEAAFHARYARYLRVCYRVALTATPHAEGCRLEGEADLGALAGGIYTYRGEMTGDKLSCSYQCRYDRGVLELTRNKLD